MKFTQELKDKWLTALRSGEYKQCQGRLQGVIDVDGSQGYCCLGVLGELAGGTFDADGRLTLSGVTKNPTDLLLHASGNNMIEGLNALSQHILARRNDSGFSFVEIADHIEQNIPAVA